MPSRGSDSDIASRQPTFPHPTLHHPTPTYSYHSQGYPIITFFTAFLGVQSCQSRSRLSSTAEPSTSPHPLPFVLHRLKEEPPRPLSAGRVECGRVRRQEETEHLHIHDRRNRFLLRGRKADGIEERIVLRSSQTWLMPPWDT
eukprot:216579-Hanusia_phi.AAC.2